MKQPSRLKTTRRSVLRLGGLSLLAGLGGAREAGAGVLPELGVVEADLVVYGGTSGGVAAAVQMSRMGKTAVLVEPGRHLGGLTSGGLGATDIGNRGAIGGMARDFYRRIHEHYRSTYGPDSQQAKDSHDGFRFEPHLAERQFDSMAREAGVPVYREHRLRSVRKRRNRVTEIVMENGAVFRAKMFIDATYEGDLMAKAKVSYTVGREANGKYGETLNGIQFGHPHHNFRTAVDPYVVEGDPSSGLLKGISGEPLGENGQGDHRVQAYNFRMCLTDVPENRIPFPKPKGYDPERYTLLARYLNKGYFEVFGNSQRMPNRKTDTNNHGAFASDNIGMNYAYPDGDYATRERIFQEHVTYQQGMMWFLCHDERVPEKVRAETSRWGLAKDEFRETGGWPHQLYVREARRMISDYVMTEHNCRGKVTAQDSIGLAAYTMDSHHVRRVVKDGRVLNEGDVQVGGFPPYPIAYRSIVPKESECRNLLVPVCLSCSHIAYGSIRMEPVFMILGQSAATAAAFAIDAGTSVQKVDIGKLQAKLLEEGQLLEWKGSRDVDTLKTDPIDPKTLKGIVLDDSDGAQTGDWHRSTRATERRVGVGYLHDGNTNKGQLSIAYTPEIPAEGEYEIVLASPPHENRAPSVPVTISVEGTPDVTVRVNQRLSAGNGFQSLGKFRLPRGKRTRVTVSNRDTEGYVVADGIQFIPTGS